jgi:hypothetical protein
MVKRLILAGVLSFAATALPAQETPAVHPVYRRAQAMVNDGNAAAGRQLVDSMIAATTPGSNEYAEGIFWRAVLAATAADAEMDYRRLVVDFPASTRVADALIRLAQLEIARLNYDGAIRHLNRVVTEHPDSPARARAGYWMARALFDKNDLPGACSTMSDALARTSESDVELRNQISYLNQRCAGVVIASTAPADSAATPSVVTAPVVAPAPRDTTVRVVVPPPAPVAAPAAAPAPPPAATASTRPPAPAPAKPATAASATGSASGNWSVQVAAYNVKSQADAMVARLKKNGYEARVDGSAAPFRVRIGRYATQGQASAVQRSLKAKQIEGFVVQAER